MYKLSDFFLKNFCVCVMCVHACRCLKGPEENAGSLAAGVTGGCEQFDAGDGN